MNQETQTPSEESGALVDDWWTKLGYAGPPVPVGTRVVMNTEAEGDWDHQHTTFTLSWTARLHGMHGTVVHGYPKGRSRHTVAWCKKRDCAGADCEHEVHGDSYVIQVDEAELHGTFPKHHPSVAYEKQRGISFYEARQPYVQRGCFVTLRDALVADREQPGCVGPTLPPPAAPEDTLFAWCCGEQGRLVFREWRNHAQEAAAEREDNSMSDDSPGGFGFGDSGEGSDVFEDHDFGFLADEF